jgi:pimeloyl-ACP methyl ester carboxylesterase
MLSFAKSRLKAPFLLAALVLAGCQSTPHGVASQAGPLACDGSIQAAFKPDALTSVVSVREYKKGDKLFVSDAGVPVTLAADLCLVKLKVGPGNPGPKEARSTSEGIGIEVWLPSHANWNERIRNYGGGGHVGGNHILADGDGSSLEKAVGSKFPAPVIAGMGFATGTTDAGQRWSQNGSFSFLPDGTLNETLLKDFSYRSLYEQAIKTKALVSLYYGKSPKFTYFDGHSTGGRQGWKVAQERPELYDGYLIAAPAIESSKFSLNTFYPQVVMKAELGYTAADPAFASANFKQKINAVNQKAVESCDREKLGFLLDPLACHYNPARDASALCKGVQGDGVVGENANEKLCVNAAEARVINKVWYGITRDGSFDEKQSADDRAGRALGPRQLWWSFPRGADWGSLVSSVGGSERVALFLKDVRYAASHQVNPSVDIRNASTVERDQWREVDYKLLSKAFDQGQAMQAVLGDIDTNATDLRKLRHLGKKVVTYTGLAEDAIPPATSVHHFQQVVKTMGNLADVQDFLRLYLVPGKAHSSQGRAYTVASAADPAKNNTVPLPKLPGIANQHPGPAEDQMFTALQHWVENGTAPQSITLTSRDNAVSYPLCVYPLKATWNGVDSSKLASSYTCQ